MCGCRERRESPDRDCLPLSVRSLRFGREEQSISSFLFCLEGQGTSPCPCCGRGEGQSGTWSSFVLKRNWGCSLGRVFRSCWNSTEDSGGRLASLKLAFRSEDTALWQGGVGAAVLFSPVLVNSVCTSTELCGRVSWPWVH